MIVARPAPAEHAPYAITYIDATARALSARGSEDLLALLQAQPAVLLEMMSGVDESRASYRYEIGKWTLAESLVHIADSERVFAYRLLRVGRGDATPLPGFEQDDWVPHSRAQNRSISDILAEISAVRSATVALVRSFDDTAWEQMGVASGRAISTRALAWMIAGHFAHHLDLTRDRYLAA